MFENLLKVINDAIAERDNTIKYYRNKTSELEQKIKELQQEVEKFKEKENNNGICS